MLKYTEGDITLEGVKIHYYRTGGKKPPVILLHGATDNGLCWTPLAENLAADHDVIMPDAQGHGLSDRFTPGSKTNNSVRQYAGLIKELGLVKPVVIGHSMGGNAAAAFAVEYSSLPRAIILEDPPWTDSPVPGTPGSRDEDKFKTDMKALGDSYRKLSLDQLIMRNRKTEPKWSEAEQIPWAQSKHQVDPELFSYPLINPRPYTEAAVLIQCPTLLIIAEKGFITRAVAENAAKIWKAKGNFKWVQIKNAGHSVRRDNFPDYMKTVRDFLKSLK
jgi:N-formylmaleamate deformylase